MESEGNRDADLQKIRRVCRGVLQPLYKNVQGRPLIEHVRLMGKRSINTIIMTIFKIIINKV